MKEAEPSRVWIMAGVVVAAVVGLFLLLQGMAAPPERRGIVDGAGGHPG